MIRYYAPLALLAACSLLLTQPAQATDNQPAPARPASGVLRTPVARAASASTAPDTTPGQLNLAGIILSPSGQPRAGVCVFPTSNPRLIAVTDAAGAFHLQVPATTTLRLQAEYVGLGSTRVEVDGQHPQAIRIVLGQ